MIEVRGEQAPGCGHGEEPRYWKFLRPGAVSPFTGYAWPPAGQWAGAVARTVEGATCPPGASTPLSGPRTCRLGFHACRQADLPYWMLEELWQVELAGQVVESADKVVAPRARLVRRVPAWNGDVARQLALACTARAARYAAAGLRQAGLGSHAERLDAAAAAVAGPVTAGAADALGELRSTVGNLADVAARAEHRRAGLLCGYVADAVDCVEGYPVASVAYIAARVAAYHGVPLQDGPLQDGPAAGTAVPGGLPANGPRDAGAAERGWQARWLVRRLGLG